MGPLFAILIWFFVSAVVGLLFGFLVSFAGIPLYEKLRHSTNDRRKTSNLKKSVIAASIAAAVVVISTGIVTYATLSLYSNVDDFSEFTGGTDWWRIPLDYPYELGTTDLGRDADLRVWKEHRSLLLGITRYHKRGSLLVGELLPERALARLQLETYPEGAWFSFDCNSGEVTTLLTIEEYRAYLNESGFETEPELLTIRQQHLLYWKNH
jgi:hypothetical protein